jgi:hypothetical protein
MKITRTILALAAMAAAPAAFADLTPDQKEFDMRMLAAHYAKHYAPYEWKRQVFGFDQFDIGPWVARARAARDDLAFYEVCAAYVSSLRDTHSSYSLPTIYSGYLGFTLDIFDGKPMVDAVSRAALPPARFPLDIGWEVVSIDGEPAETLLERYAAFVYRANDRSRRRAAAQFLSFRPQSRIPRAHETDDTASVVMRDLQGAEHTFTIPWMKRGTPITSAGRVPTPFFGIANAASPSRLGRPGREPEQPDNREKRDSVIPEYLEPLAEWMNDHAVSPVEVTGVGSRTPVYAPPDGFIVRRGNSAVDTFLSGTYRSGGFNLGLIRIPNFGPASVTAAIREFETEIQFMQANTDGLIVDITRNNGGDACYNEELQRRLIPYEFRGIAREIRVTTRFLIAFSNALDLARARGAEPHVILQMEARLAEIQQGFRENRSRTGPLPICAETLIRQPAPIVYRRPLLVLIDDQSISAADAFAAVLQDARRGPLFGWRTNGAGGTTGGFPVGVFSEGFASHTIAMHHRRDPVATPDFPAAPYVENIGVRPDIEYDNMTRENLVDRFRPFVREFTAAIVEHIRRSTQ